MPYLLPETPQTHFDGWRESDDPFYALTASFLNGEGATPYLESNPNPDLEYWGEHPPEKIIFATASVTKSLMLSAALLDRLPPFEHPETLQYFFSKNIKNGDGALKKPALLGYIHGVPVYAEPAAEAETLRNNPREEAQNKASHIAERYQREGKHVLVLAGDTVDWPDYDGDDLLSEGEGLGKPQNSERYPKREKYASDQEFDQAVSDFDVWYKENNYVPSADLLHVNMVALMEVLPSQIVIDAFIKTLITNPITPSAVEKMVVYPEMGGGAGTQAMIAEKLKNPAEVLASLDEKSQEILGPLSQENPREFLLLVYFMIMGMPVKHILQAIDEFTASGIVVFEASKSYSG